MIERAEAFTERSSLTKRMARLVMARRGATCHKCGARATHLIDGKDLCALDAQVARNRMRRAAMHGAAAVRTLFHNEGTLNMATEIIAGRAGTQTIVSDSSAPFGELQVGPPITPDDPSRYAIVWRTDGEILKQAQWTREQLDVARSFLGFPKGEVTTSTGWVPKQSRRVRATDVDTWFERLRAVTSPRR